MTQVEQARAEAVLEGDVLAVDVSGDWAITAQRPSWSECAAGKEPGRVRIRAAGLDTWDSSLALFLKEAAVWCEARGVPLHTEGFPPGVTGLVDLMQGSATQRMARRVSMPDIPATVGRGVFAIGREIREIAHLVGECAYSLARFLRGHAQFRWRDCFAEMQQCGAMALPIVSLISFLIGVILAYQGAIQLRQYGADIYVADMVGVAIVREMGPLMMAIVLAGRTGAAFAATLGNMKANEELDALVTLGVSPIDFLVLPRISALFLMMPLLALYANGLGVIGGLVISQVILDIPANAYWIETKSWVDLSDVSTGLIKAATFGLLVGVAGCLRGLQADRSAAGVGRAATEAVVTGILLLIVADAVYAVVFNILGW